MIHVSFIQNLDNLDAYLYSDRQSPNFLSNEIQSNLNLLRNAAKSIECSNYKQSWIIQFLPCHVLVLSFGMILNHIEHFIEERCSYYSLSMDTHVCKMAAVIYLVLAGEVLSNNPFKK